MARVLKLLLVFVNIFALSTCDFRYMVEEDFLKVKDFVFWPNATVPFFIHPMHFDHEQSLSIMRSLALFGFRTCIKFVPTLVEPEGNTHVMVFENPDGIRKCHIDNKGHNTDGPHRVVLGYSCLTSPEIEMILMLNLGFPYEHNRVNRDEFISVEVENIQPLALEMFTKNKRLPSELDVLPYDYNSVMHFDTRQFSKNGHRTIIFKDHHVSQERRGLSTIDLRKLDIVYGPECRKRDREEKIALCQNYPGVARRKRDVASAEPPKVTEKLPLDDATVNLRVNRDITPPPNGAESSEPKDVSLVLRELGIEDQVTGIMEEVNKVAAKALENARLKYCSNSTNNTIQEVRDETKIAVHTGGASDILDIINHIANYSQSMVNSAKESLTIFCANSMSLEHYQRSCPFYSSRQCPQKYRSTKSGAVKYSTQHRPLIRQSTQHRGPVKHYLRASDDNEKADAPAKEASESDKSVTPGALRSGTQVIYSSNIKYAPNYRSSNDSGKSRRKREAPSLSPASESAASGANVAKSEVQITPSDANVSPSEAKASSGVKQEAPTVNNSKHNRRRRRVYRVGSADEEPNGRRQSGENYEERPHKPSDVIRRRKMKNPVPLQEYEEAEVQASNEEFGQPIEEEQQQEEETPRPLMKRKPLRYQRMRSRVAAKDEEEETPEVGKRRRPVVKRKPIRNRIRMKVPAKAEQEESSIEDEQIETPVREVKKPVAMKQKPRTVKLSKQNKEFYGDRRWPLGVVPYVISKEPNYDLDDMRSRIEEVNSILKAKTCTRLLEIADGTESKYNDYLILDTSPDFVTGHVGGKQKFGVLELFEGGQHRQHAAMMVMAMLGFYFEVSRHDRDEYIRVHSNHVRPDKLHHLEKIRADATFPLPYDYQSATHPSWQFWREIGRTGISSVATFKQKDPDGSIMKSLGQNEELLSELDLVKINSVYGTRCFKN